MEASSTRLGPERLGRLSVELQLFLKPLPTITEIRVTYLVWVRAKLN